MIDDKDKCLQYKGHYGSVEYYAPEQILEVV